MESEELRRQDTPAGRPCGDPRGRASKSMMAEFLEKFNPTPWMEFEFLHCFNRPGSMIIVGMQRSHLLKVNQRLLKLEVYHGKESSPRRPFRRFLEGPHRWRGALRESDQHSSGGHPGRPTHRNEPRLGIGRPPNGRNDSIEGQLR